MVNTITTMDEGRRDGHEYQAQVDPAHWEVIREFVRDVVRSIDGRVPYQTDAMYYAVSQFTLWAWQSAGLPLETKTLFTRSVIAYYVEVGCGQLTVAARGNRRSLLLKIAEHLRGELPVRLRPLPSSDPSAPYDSREVVSIISWARAQSTQERRINAHLLVSIGFGAGLSAVEIIRLRTRHIHRTGNEVDVIVDDGRVRSVPVLHSFATLMPDLSHRHPDSFAFRPHRTSLSENAISNFVARAKGIGLSPQTQRMRATWVIHHLNAGTPLRALMAGAGLESIDALARFERFLAPVDPMAAAQLLRYALTTQ